MSKTVTVKANAHVLGLRVGQTAEVADTAYLRKVIDSGRVELVEEKPKSAAGKSKSAGRRRDEAAEQQSKG